MKLLSPERILAAVEEAEGLLAVELVDIDNDDEGEEIAWYTINPSVKALLKGAEYLQFILEDPPHHSSLFPVQSILHSLELATAAVEAR